MTLEAGQYTRGKTAAGRTHGEMFRRTHAPKEMCVCVNNEMFVSTKISREQRKDAWRWLGMC